MMCPPAFSVPALSAGRIPGRIKQSAEMLGKLSIISLARRSNGKRLIELHRADSAADGGLLLDPVAPVGTRIGLRKALLRKWWTIGITAQRRVLLSRVERGERARLEDHFSGSKNKQDKGPGSPPAPRAEPHRPAMRVRDGTTGVVAFSALVPGEMAVFGALFSSKPLQ